MSTTKSYYVKREREDRIGFIGSIRSERQAQREAAAWRPHGWITTVLPNTLEVRREVRAWQQSVAERRFQA